MNVTTWNTRNVSENKSPTNVAEWNAANSPNVDLLSKNLNVNGEVMMSVTMKLPEIVNQFLLDVLDVPELNVVTSQERMVLQQTLLAGMEVGRLVLLRQYPNAAKKKFQTSVSANNAVITRLPRVNKSNSIQHANGSDQKCVIQSLMSVVTFDQHRRDALEENAANMNALDEIHQRLSNVNSLLLKNAKNKLSRNVRKILWQMDVFKRYVARSLL